MDENGRKNCLVAGTSNAAMSKATAPVFARGPGASAIDREKTPRMINIMYCASYADHLCARRARTASYGDNDVLRPVSDDAGDFLERSFERNLRRYLWGIGFGIDEGHEKGSFGL